MRINLPNQITLGRLILAIVFFVLLSGHDQAAPNPTVLNTCLVIFVVAALTDILDGYLARKQNQVTSLGRVLDPFVDKVLICGAFVFFCSSLFVDSEGVNVTGVRAWMVVVIVGRELLVSVLRSFTEAGGRAYASALTGKIKMVLQSVTAGLVLLVVANFDPPTGNPAMYKAMAVLVWMTVAVTALSMLQYLARSKQILADATRT